MINVGHPAVSSWARQMVDKSMDLLEKIWSAARRWLAPWIDPVLAWNTHDTTIDLDAFQQHDTPATLYLNVSVEDLQGRLRPIVRLLLDLLSLRLCDRPEHAYRHDVLWVLDDLPELHYLAFVDRLHAYLRGFGHLLLGGAQAFSQIDHWYGRDSALLNNARAWVAFPPMHHREAAFLSEKMGETTVMEPADRLTRSWGRRSRTSGLQSHRRLLMTPEEVQGLGEDQVLLFVRGHPTMLVGRGPLEEAA
jgi:type IV secretory pathway TraG/TraD family ATPase VirD4